MGRVIRAAKNLIPPFHTIEEWTVPISPGQFIEAKDPDFHLVFILEGESLLEIPGHSVMRLSKGDAHSVSFASSCTMRSPHPEREMRLQFLRLKFRWAPTRLAGKRQVPNAPEKRFEEALRQKLIGFQHFPNILTGERYLIARHMLAEMEKPTESATWVISGLLQALTAGLLTDAKPAAIRAPRRHRHKDAIIGRTLQYLEENCHEALTLNSIAWHMQLSGEHLARLFKKETKRTVFSWLDSFRVEKARNLLTATEQPLTQIARACGYSSSNLFIRHFKKNIGIPPVAYRIKAQKKEAFSPSKMAPIPEESQTEPGENQPPPESLR